MTTIDKQFETINKLHKIRNNYIAEQKILKEAQYAAENQEIDIEKAKRQLSVFKDYEQPVFETKVKLDNYIYDHFLSKYEESDQQMVIEQLENLYVIVNSIYEQLNISPQININFKHLTLESSEIDLVAKGKDIINNYLTENYYKLSSTQKSEKYSGPVVDRCITMIQESDDSLTEEAIQEHLEFCYKSQVLVGLLETITLPYLVKCNITSCLNNDAYKDIFDSDQLRESMDVYDKQIDMMSKLFAVVS